MKKATKAKQKKYLEKILAENPEESDAKMLLAKIYLFEDPNKSLSLISNIEHSSENEDIFDSIQIISSLITRLNNKSISFESPVLEKYIAAINDLKNKDFDSSLNKFIDVIRNDRKLDDDGARQACIAIFKYLGEDNEITLKHRRDFGSALYI